MIKGPERDSKKYWLKSDMRNELSCEFLVNWIQTCLALKASRFELTAFWFRLHKANYAKTMEYCDWCILGKQLFGFYKEGVWIFPEPTHHKLCQLQLGQVVHYWFLVCDLTCSVGKWCIICHWPSGIIQVLPFCPKFTIFEDPSAKQFVESV